MRAIYCVVALLILAGCDKNEVGDVSLGIFTTKDIKLDAFADPVVTGVTCHVASIEANLDLSDPSDSSLACRQTGPITLGDIAKGPEGEEIFRESRSLLLKTLRVTRIFDEANNSLIYLTHAAELTEGSAKMSISTVPLWNAGVKP